MNDEFIKLDKRAVGIVKALNSVFTTQNLSPFTITGHENYFLHKEFQTKESIPKDFRDYFLTLPYTKIEKAEIKQLNLSEFNNYENEADIRAAFNPYQRENLPEFIYHYTTADGLIGIVESQYLWATHYSFLNDYKEFEYAKELIKEIILLKLGDSEYDIAVKENWDFFESQFKYYSTYLVSFSTERDRLSQWRGYSQHGNGYSISFKTKNIGLCTPPNRRRQSFTVRPVLYDVEKQRGFIIEAINATIKYVKESNKEIENARAYALEFYHYLHWNCLLLIVTCKSPHFQEEQEWRAIQLQDDPNGLNTDLEVNFRVNSNKIIPYIRLDINSEVGEEHEKFPLNEIVYGSALNPELAERGLTLLTRDKLKKNVMITRSNLTLR